MTFNNLKKVKKLNKKKKKVFCLQCLDTWKIRKGTEFNAAYFAHYSKSLIFVQKFNFDKIPTFSRVPPPIVLTIFLVKSKLSTAKKSKTAAFSRIFHPKKSPIFSGNQMLIFGQKTKILNSVIQQSIFELLFKKFQF